MRVGVSVLSTDGRLRGFAGRAAGRSILRSGCCAAAIAAALLILPSTTTWAETLPEVLVRTYQGNPVLNAERARLRGIDETVPMAVAAYRPQIMAMLTGGLQQVRVLFPDNTVQTATLRTWTIGADGLADAVQRLQDREHRAAVRVAMCAPDARPLRNVGQGVLLDAVTAYTNVLANQSLVEAQRINSTFLRETLGTTQRRLDAGDVTPTDVAQAEARLSRGLADLNAAEVALAVSQAAYAQVIGAPPGPAGQSPNRSTGCCRATRGGDRDQPDRTSRHPGAMYDTDGASSAIKIAEAACGRPFGVQASVSRNCQTDPTLGANGTDIASSSAAPTCRSTTAAWPPRRSGSRRNSVPGRIVLERIAQPDGDSRSSPRG